MKKTALSLCVFFVVLAFAVSGVAKEIKKDFHESFDVEEGFTLHLDHGDGDVTITPWYKDIVDVEVRYRADVKSVGIGGRHDFDVEFKQAGKVIHVIERIRTSGSIGYRYFKRYEYTYTIRAPQYIQLDLEGEDGDVEIRNWRARIDCISEDGDIELDDVVATEVLIDLEDGDLNIRGLQGDLVVDSEDGDVVLRDGKTPSCRISLEDGDLTIRQSEGDFEIDVEDGEVELYQIRAGMLDIRAEDGDIDADLLKTEDIDLDVATEDGDVIIDLEPGISATFSIETEEGRIRVDLPNAKDLREKRRRASGELGDGDGRIRIDTGGGDVILRESD